MPFSSKIISKWIGGDSVNVVTISLVLKDRMPLTLQAVIALNGGLKADDTFPPTFPISWFHFTFAGCLVIVVGLVLDLPELQTTATRWPIHPLVPPAKRLPISRGMVWASRTTSTKRRRRQCIRLKPFNRYVRGVFASRVANQVEFALHVTSADFIRLQLLPIGVHPLNFAVQFRFHL